MGPNAVVRINHDTNEGKRGRRGDDEGTNDDDGTMNTTLGSGFNLF